LLLNLIGYAAKSTREPSAPLSADFQAHLKEIGYAD
jgi:hypothetical protein